MRLGVVCSVVLWTVHGSEHAKIIGGTVATGGLGFVTSIMWCDTHGEGCSSVCTGSLIAPNVVLTAAHCIRPSLSPLGSNELSKRLNTLYVLIDSLNYKNRSGGAELVPVVSAKFGSYGTNIAFPFDGDIALLELGQCLSGIELAKVATRSSEPVPGSCANVTVAGFGRVSNAPDAVQDSDGALRFITEKQHSYSTCRNAFIALSMGGYAGSTPVDSQALLSSVSPSVSRAVVPENLICAGGTTSSKVCHGDSGGPTFTLMEDGLTAQIIGITSFIFSPGFCSIGPSFSTRISSYSSFIKSALQNSVKRCPGWSVSNSFASWPLEPEPAWSDRCSENQWQCLSLECIDESKVCDGVPDCNDGSDETYVSPQTKTALCASHQRKLVEDTCSSATLSLQEAIKDAKSQYTIADVWGTKLSENACAQVASLCEASSVSKEQSQYCSQLKNFLQWNVTGQLFTESFGFRFNATCPDDEYIGLIRQAYAPEDSGSSTAPLAPPILVGLSIVLMTL